jgi:hypothetical protein
MRQNFSDPNPVSDAIMFSASSLGVSNARTLLLAAAIGYAALEPAAAADRPFQSFIGEWSGGGQVNGTNGHHEPIR